MRRLPELRTRFWIEGVLAFLSGLLLLATAAWPDWIELVFRVDPDRGSGALEWVIVGVVVLWTASMGVLARLEWRRAARG
jgi:hypothetical protein